MSLAGVAAGTSTTTTSMATATAVPFTEEKALAIVVLFLGSVALPLLVAIAMEYGRLTELYRKCQLLTRYLKSRKPLQGNLEEYCGFRSYDCDVIIKEKKRLMESTIISIAFALFYLSYGLSWFVGSSDWQSVLILLILASMFPLVMLFITHRSADEFAGLMGRMEGFVKSYYECRENNAPEDE